MDYLTLKKHIAYLSERLKCRPVVIRAYDAPGRSIFLRLKTSEGVLDLNICLDPPNQGIRLADKCVDVEKNSLIVRALNRTIINSRLNSIELAGNESEGSFDRVVKLHFVAVDEYFGHRTDYYIFGEFTGRISDAFLCDSDYKILDRISRTSNNLVGGTYKLPDSFHLLNPETSDSNELLKAFGAPSSEWLNKIGLLSPQVTKEIIYRTNESEKADIRLKALMEIVHEAKISEKAWLYKKDGKLTAISAFELKHLCNAECIGFANANTAMNFVEDELNGPKRLEQEKKRVVTLLNRDLKQKKLLLQEQEKLRVKYEGADKYQEIGNLITANLYRIKPGSVFLEAEDWNTGEAVKIELDPTRTPAANAKKYFNLYKKSKRGIVEVDKRIEALNSDIKWFEEQIWLAENAETESWLLFEENTKTDRRARQKEQSNKNKSAKKPKVLIKPEVEQNNCRYYIGHNAKQNDQITFQIGKKGDLWFHANDVPGAHVILKKLEGEITEEDILLGAQLAAKNSFAKDSSKVPVDYTDVSNVKRIPGGGPGHVNYVRQHTVYVTLGR
mgnify:CR=1 FL=1